MFRRLAIVASALFLVGCAYSPSVPENYSGPRASLDDSFKVHNRSKADFFVAETIDGNQIDNSLLATVRANKGRGMIMTPMSIARPLVAENPVKVGVRGRTHHAAPILGLTQTVYQVQGVIEFTPQANVKYVVRGELGPSYSAVWIEELETKQVIGNKVEITGSAKLGVFQK